MVGWNWWPRAKAPSWRNSCRQFEDSGLRRNIQDEDIVWEEAQDKFRGFEIAG